jgi:hypothetical protein
MAEFAGGGARDGSVRNGTSLSDADGEQP